MYYKIIKNGKVIDLLDELVFVKYQAKNNLILRCSMWEAEGILSSDRNYVWHEKSLIPFPISGYDTVEVVQIDEHEYKSLKALGGKTPEEIIDAYTLLLIEEGVL